jgi:hypothetical protein
MKKIRGRMVRRYYEARNYSRVVRVWDKKANGEVLG